MSNLRWTIQTRGAILNKIILLSLAGLLTCFSQQSMCQSNSNLDEDLRHSQLCAKATKEFRAQPEWNNLDEPRTFTSHFNKKMGKCLVKVTSSNVVSGEVMEMQHVYDAIEGTVLGGEILTKEIIPHDGEQRIIGITMVRDGKLLGKQNKDEAREAYQWFETLMKE